MKRKNIIRGLLAVALIFISTQAFAVNLAWTDPNSVQMGVTHYTVYWEKTDGSTITEGQAQVDGYQNTHVTIPDTHFLYGISYDFTVTASNSVGESPRSDTLTGIAADWPGGEQVPEQVTGLQFVDQAGMLIDENHIIDAQ